MRILILEDDALIGMELQYIVEDFGHEVIALCGTIAAMRQRLAEAPDFAFLDVDLPDGKSFEIAARLDERSVPFAFLSGSRRSDLPENLRHSRFISKPYAPAAIRNALSGGGHRLAC